MSESPPTLVCNDNSTHPSHFWQEPHTGQTCWCPGHTEVK